MSTVDTVDTYRCAADGAAKVGRTALQSFLDGSTIAWGERDYRGTLWPRTIVEEDVVQPDGDTHHFSWGWDESCAQRQAAPRRSGASSAGMIGHSPVQGGDEEAHFWAFCPMPLGPCGTTI